MMEVSSSLQEPERRSTSSQRSGEEVSSSSRTRKHEVCCEIIRWLTESGHVEVNEPGFSDELQAHFNRLPIRYAMDVNIERAEDVLMHKRLLEMAAIPENRPVFHVRSVQVLPLMLNEEISDAISPKVSVSHSASKLNAHPPPAFGSSPNLEALTLDQNKSTIDDDSNGRNWPSSGYDQMPTHEVTVSSIDKPKLLSQLSSWLADVGLNIREAHAFSTVDGYSLDVFIVDGWKTEDTEDLRAALKNVLATTEKRVWSRASPPSRPSPSKGALLERESTAPSDGKDDWEIDSDQLKLLHKVASGSYGDLYRGTYCGQDVAIKILKPDRLNDELQKEFSQEVFIMRKVRHKNVVQFIGACTKPPDLCIVTEFMAGGSVYDYIHKHKSIMKLPMLLRVAIDVSKGMDYLHQNNIIHRDLKAANLLMDENEVVKVADFGVARIQDQSGIMTAETGTYRWMAPEVIEHKPYDNKADIFSFGIVLWELLTGRLPYDFLSPLQAAVAVVQKGLRPTIPKGTHPRLAELLEVCWQANPADRPSFSEITAVLQDIYREAEEESENEKGKEKKGGLFSAFRRTA